MNNLKLSALSLAILTLTVCVASQASETATATTDKPILKEVHDATPADNIGIPIKMGMFIKKQNQAVAEPFVGITTSDGKVEGLFELGKTGVSTAPIVESATAFINSLTQAQKDKTLYAYNSEEWRRWLNVDNALVVRNGTPIKEMSDEQKALAFEMMSTSLGAKGYALSRNIMKTDQTLREFNNDDPAYDEELYFITIMGEPSTTEPWGWQIDGHHLAINFVVVGDQVVMSPAFLGAEPAITKTGKYAGQNTLFQDEQNLGLKFMQSLPADMQAKATISPEKTEANIEAGAGEDNKVIDYQGVKVGDMTDVQKAQLTQLIEQYIGNMNDGHAKIKMSEIQQHLDDTYWAWRGATDDEAVFYYRIHSPVVMIEFDHQPYIGMTGKGKAVTRDHVHTMIRTPNGNDYGKDYLQQHLEHSHANGTTHSH